MELVKKGKNIYMAMIHIAISPDNRNACGNKTFEIASKPGNGWHVWMNKRLTFQINGSSVDRDVDAVLYHKEHGLRKSNRATSAPYR